MNRLEKPSLEVAPTTLHAGVTCLQTVSNRDLLFLHATESGFPNFTFTFSRKRDSFAAVDLELFDL